MIASVSKTSKIVVEKSTVPVKTAEAIEKVGSALPWRSFQPRKASASAACCYMKDTKLVDIKLLVWTCRYCAEIALILQSSLKS